MTSRIPQAGSFAAFIICVILMAFAAVLAVPVGALLALFLPGKWLWIVLAPVIVLAALALMWRETLRGGAAVLRAVRKDR